MSFIPISRAATARPVVEVTNFSRRFGDVTVLDGIDLAFDHRIQLREGPQQGCLARAAAA